MSKAYWKLYNTKGSKVYLEDGSMIDLFDNHTNTPENMNTLVASLANVIQTYGITTLLVTDPMMADETIENIINQILTENFAYNEHVTMEVVE
jgi:hypothetical protein